MKDGAMHIAIVFLSALGLAFIFEALPYILVPKKMKGILFEMAMMPALALQRMGIIIFLLGLALVCFAFFSRG